MTYPDPIYREINRIWQKWYREMPAFISLPRREKGKAVESWLRCKDALPGLLEQASEFHQRMAVKRLKAFRKNPTRRRSAKAAESIMFSNLARVLFNRAFGQDPTLDLPFWPTG